MLVAPDIFDEVDVGTILLNGEVVRRAFKGIEKIESGQRLVEMMSNCEENTEHDVEQRADLLERYLLAEAVAKSAWSRVLAPLTEQEKNAAPIWRTRQNRHAYAAECDQRKNELEAKLRACESRLKGHNPRERKRPWLMKPMYRER